MDSYLFSVFIHTIAASFWIGGMLFLPTVMLPSLKDYPEKRALLLKAGLKFRFYGWISLIILFTSGFTNVYFRGLTFSRSFFLENSYGQWVSYKLFIFLIILILSAAHDFLVGKRALSLESLDGRWIGFARWSGRFNLLLALFMMVIGIKLSRGIF